MVDLRGVSSKSKDSRHFGLVKPERIVGEVMPYCNKECAYRGGCIKCGPKAKTKDAAKFCGL